MGKSFLAVAAMAILAFLLAACAAKAEVPTPQVIEVEKVVTVEVPVEKEVIKEVPVEKEVIKEVPVEKIVTVEKVVTVVVEKEVTVEVEKVVTVEVEKKVTVEKVLIATPTPPPAGTPRFGGTLRIVSQASIASLDPIWTSSYVTIAVSTHMYEGPFGWDTSLKPAPRMVDNWSLSPDGTVYTFTLRDGLTFHDGRTVTSKDVIASIARWLAGTVSPQSTMVREFAQENPLRAVDDRTFTFNLKEPYGALLTAFAAPWQSPLVMPAELAANPPTVAVEDWTGSGPYKFAKWDPGNQVVLDRYSGYVRRNEPPDHMVGGTMAYLDRMVWLEIPDEETKIAGLETGEWDLVDGAGLDFFKRLNSNPDLVVPLYKPGHRSNIILNDTHRPFGHPKSEAPEGRRLDDRAVAARQAVLYGVDIEKIMTALGPHELWILCSAIYYCGTPLDQTNVGPEYYNINDKVRAAKLLDQSGYSGNTIVLLNPTDYATITPIGIVVKQEMEEIGFNVETPALDWSTVVTKFRDVDTWEAAASWTVHWCCGDPIADEAAAESDPFSPGIPQVLELRKAWATELDPTRKREIREDIERLLYEKVNIVHLGQFFSIYPHTAALKNLRILAVPYYANSWLER